jgi:hypothetical protein
LHELSAVWYQYTPAASTYLDALALDPSSSLLMTNQAIDYRSRSQ